MRKVLWIACLLLAWAVLAACSSSSTSDLGAPAADAGTWDSGAKDARPADTGSPLDAASLDASAADAPAADAPAADAVGIDAAAPDATAADAAAPDAIAPDATAPDASTPDSGACAPRPSGLIGWWPGNDTTDDVVGGVNGAWVGTSSYATGKVGRAFSFNGSNHVVSQFSYSGPFSVDFWVKAAIVGQGVYAAPLSSSLGTQDPYFQFDFDGQGNYRIQAGSDALHVPIGTATTTRFQHLAMTYDGTVIRTYLDGTFSSSAAWAGSTLRFEVIKFGLNRTENDPFQGIVDEVHVFNRPLADAEIRQIYRAASLGLCAQPFALLVTQSAPGPQNNNPASWQGVLQYTAAAESAPLVPAASIDHTQVADPAGLAYRASSHEVFVGNRHGNNAADGVAGSISRFVYDPLTRTLTANGEITGNSLSGVHQLTFDPVSGDLFAANFGGGVSRFRISATGTVTAAGLIGTGSMRGVLVAPDGMRLFATSAGDVIRQFDLGTGNELASIQVAGGATLHYFAIRGTSVYVAGLGTNKVYRLTLGAQDTLVLRDAFDADSPVAVAFSSNGLEMFTAGHRSSDIIDRFRYDAVLDTWAPTTTVNSMYSLGGMIILP